MGQEIQQQDGRTAAGEIERLQLVERILRQRAARLTVLRAPAGFGKSTLLGQLRRALLAQGWGCAALSLETGDNDASRLVARLQQALFGGPADGTAPEALLHRLARIEGPFALLLDDFEHLQEAAVLALLRELLERLPSQGRLLLAGRGRPDLGLGRLRARGELQEIEIDALRFSEAEARVYIAAQPLVELSEEALANLHRKTEGWPAGLAMAAAVLQRLPAGNGFMRQLCASDQALAGYLREAVLDQLSFETQQLLLRASILHRLEPALCERLLPGSDARRILAGLAGEMFIVSPVEGSEGADGATGQLRMHGLFAEVLRDRLRRSQPDLALRLHLSASGWYEQQGRADLAIEHALAGGDLPHAAGLLQAHAEAFIEQGRLRMLARWLARLPPDLIAASARLRIAALWAEIFERGPQGAWVRLQELEEQADGEPAVRAHLAALRPLVLAMLDRYEEAAQLAQLPPALSAASFAEVVRSNAMAHVLSVAGEAQRSLPLLDRARGAPEGSASAFTRRYTEAVEGQIDLHQGRLREASARLRMAAAVAPGRCEGAYNHAHGNVWAGVLYAATVYESGRLEQARALLNACLPLVRDLALPDHMILAHGLGARIAFLRGEVDAALTLLKELEYLGHHRQLPRVVAAARLELGWLCLRQGRSLLAGEAIARAALPGVWDRVARLRLPAHEHEDLLIARMRWALHFDSNPAAAAETLRVELEQTAHGGRGRRALKLRLLRAMALQRAGDWAAALQEARAMLLPACREGFQRLLLDEGPALAPLLQRLRGEAGSEPLLDDYLQRLLLALQVLPAAAPDEAASAPAAVTLTGQELRVLHFLAEGYSNGAMAEKLKVSDSTVRTHLRSINLKLGAHSRSQAVAQARRLAVLK